MGGMGLQRKHRTWRGREKKSAREREETAGQQRERADRGWSTAVEEWAQRDRASVLVWGVVSGRGSRRSESVLVWGVWQGAPVDLRPRLQVRLQDLPHLTWGPRRT